MEQFKLQLEKLAIAEDLESIFIATEDGELLLHIDGPAKSEYGNIQKILFGGVDEIKFSCNAIDGMILPQTYEQGNDQAVYSRVGRLFYGLFYVGKLPPESAYNKSKILSHKVEKLIGESDLLHKFK